MYTLCINNGLVIDPETETARIASVGVENGRIAPLEAEMQLNAAGHVVCPGFIDVHGHVDNVTAYPDHEACARLSLLQGVTTMVSGNCGLSVPDVAEFFRKMDQGYPFHHAELIGGSTLRRMAGHLHPRHRRADCAHLRAGASGAGTGRGRHFLRAGLHARHGAQGSLRPGTRGEGVRPSHHGGHPHEG